jgi:hypothetical protein
MLKFYMAKAFDSVSWPFLIQILQHRGFGPRMISRLVTMFSTANTKVLINGTAGQRFWHAKGLRQGDPVSPTLFIIMMDVLGTPAVRLAEEHGIFSPFSQSGIKHVLSLFADDVVMLIKPSRVEAEVAIQILQHFGEASGLHCNLAKSSATPIRCEDIDLQQVMGSLQCPVKDFPVQYLGLPLTISRWRRTCQRGRHRCLSVAEG